MKKKVLNENESIISTMFTEKELAELKFTPEEIEALENAELISQAADFMPNSEKDMDAFFEKYDKTFPPSDDMFGTFKKFVELQKTDPDFYSQIIAMNALVDVVEEVPEATTEKVSLDDIKKEQNAQLSEERKAKFAKIDAMLKKMAEEKK